MPIVQISRIQNRRGKAVDLPQLASGELGWAIDEQRLFIGNGTVADGAPAVGNTEILTSSSASISASFSSAISYVYKGYLGLESLTDVSRTLQQRLDDYVSVRAFGAVGDGVSDDTSAIQDAIDQLYCNVIDTGLSRSYRILFFPAGTYNISTSLKIPPHAHLVGEGSSNTVIYQEGGACSVAVTKDNKGNVYPNIGNASGIVPTQIKIQGISFQNGENYGGFSIDCATNLQFVDCAFTGTYSFGSADDSRSPKLSKGITLKSTTALPCANIVFDRCFFSQFARLVDISYDARYIKFNNCSFGNAYYGAMIAETTDGVSNGLTKGPIDLKIISSYFYNIMAQALWVKSIGGTIENIVSFNNFYAASVSMNNGGVNSLVNFPVIEFDRGECTTQTDYFEILKLRSSTLPPVTTVFGAGSPGSQQNVITLLDNQSTPHYLINFPVTSTQTQSISLTYKITRGSIYRYGVFTVSCNNDPANLIYSDNSISGSGDVGVTLSASLANLGGGISNDTLQIQYTTTSTGTNAVLSYSLTQLI